MCEFHLTLGELATEIRLDDDRVLDNRLRVALAHEFPAMKHEDPLTECSARLS